MVVPTDLSQPTRTAQALGCVQNAVDHDHETGNIRGLLCSNCNGILGRADDNPEVFLNAIKYLENEGTAMDIIDQEQARNTRKMMEWRITETNQMREENKKAREETINTFLRGGYSDN